MARLCAMDSSTMRCAAQRAGLRLRLRCATARASAAEVVTRMTCAMRVVLGLRQQVGRDEARIGRIVGDDQHFRRTRGQVDGGAGGIRRRRSVWRPSPRRCRVQRSCPPCERSRCQRPAPRWPVRRPSCRRCRCRRARRRPAPRRAPCPLRSGELAMARDRTAGHARRHREHDGRGRQRRRTRGHVQADTVDGSRDALADHAGHGLDAQRLRCAALRESA